MGVMDSSSGELATQTNRIKVSTINHAKKKAHWIAGAIKHKGALHRQLGVPAGKKIPQSKLKSAEAKGGLVAKRARFAELLKQFH